jgi:hypothetical protein
MKTNTPYLFVAAIFILLLANPSGAAPADTNPPPRLTVELRDGSRVIGQSVETSFKFHSALLGDLKLAVQDIRSIDCISSNAAKLSTVKGDALTVSFADEAFAVKTSFGKVDLTVASVRKISVSASDIAGGHPPGLVALWSGEGDGRDSVGENNGTLTDISFAEGKLGQAFAFNGMSSCMTMGENQSLNVGTGTGLTVSAWIKPSDIQGLHPIAEWSIYGRGGVNLWIGHQPGDQGVLCADFVDTESQNHFLISPPGAVSDGRFQQVAMTYDKASGVGALYLNGAIVIQSKLGSFVPLTGGEFFISRRVTDPGTWSYNKYFAGLMDDIAIYNRALSAAEIEAVCRADNNGELPPAPRPDATRPFNRNFRNSFRNGFSE